MRNISEFNKKLIHSYPQDSIMKTSIEDINKKINSEFTGIIKERFEEITTVALTRCKTEMDETCKSIKIIYQQVFQEIHQLIKNYIEATLNMN